MPPNIRFPLNLPVGDELIHVAQSTSQNAPQPLTLDHHDEAAEDGFFLHDIEENAPIHVETNGTNQESVQLTDTEQASENFNRRPNEHDYEHDHDHHHHARRVIRHLASQISDPEELDIDQKRLYKAVSDAGEFSYGVIACEVWLLEDDKLIRPKGGWWHNQKLYQHSNELESLAATEPTPLIPGVDLPGILWLESHRDGSTSTIRQSQSTSHFRRVNRSTDSLDQHGIAIHGLHTSSIGNGLFSSTKVSTGDLAGAHHLHSSIVNPHALAWRDLKSIAEDPDSAKTSRLGQLLDAGLHAAAAVPFHIKEYHAHAQGLVIYFARCHTRTHLLSNVANDAFLRASAQSIGHAAALSETRRASVEARKRQTALAANRFKKNLLGFHHETISPGKTDGVATQKEGVGREEKVVLEDDFIAEDSPWQEAKHRFHTWGQKCLGGNLQVPPPLSVRQTLWTIFGAFCGLLVLSSLNEYYKILSDEDYFLLIGPFGALMTLQYGLTSAPASQPRNAILGQAVSGAVSLAFTYIPESILPTWLRRAVGPAFAIGTMVKLGVTHPPAGAHAVLYASGDYNFGFYALVVLSSAISVIPATLVNNLSTKRQYPTYWTMVQFPQILWAKNLEDSVASIDKDFDT